ncbi:MAG: transposase [Rhodospirillaceae bacterium]|nr:transposase [Rhodospirillaceae bacterium]
MARIGRWFAPGVPQHIIQRGNNRQAVFFDTEDYRAYKDWLAEIAAAHGLAVHAYVLMTNHVHLLATPETPESIPAVMQTLGRLYVRRVNMAYRRTGSLWEGRYRANVVEDETYLFRLMRYIELNPVRARMTRAPRGYPWSSHAANAHGKADVLVTPHELYRALGRTASDRAAAYRELFREALAKDALTEIRRALNGGWALGSERFQREVARAARRRAVPLKRGLKPDKAKVKAKKARRGADKAQVKLL